MSTSTSATVTEPTALTVNPGTSDFADQTTVSGTLTDTNKNVPVANEPVMFSLNGSETCTGTTNASGVASCPITPGEAAGNYTLSGSFAGDKGLPGRCTASVLGALQG